MMTFNNAKIQINMAVRAGKFDDSLGLAQTNKTITCCLLYTFLKSLGAVDNTFDGQVRSLIGQYLDTYINIVENLRTKYVSYSVMKNYLQSIGNPQFTEMTETQVNRIADLYHDKTEIKLFSKNEFSQAMYNINDLGIRQYERLREIHYAIMVPIFQYYIDNYGAKPSDIEIFSISSVENNPGKVIIFKIDKIDPAKIITDIRDIIGIRSYIYSESQYLNNYVKIVIK